MKRKYLALIFIIAILLLSTIAAAGFWQDVTGMFSLSKLFKKYEANPLSATQIENRPLNPVTTPVTANRLRGTARSICSDSDGNNSTAQGTVSYSSSTFTDYCDTTTSVMEYTCTSISSVGNRSIRCSSGEMCFGGKCRSACYDTDDGNHSIKGYRFNLREGSVSGKVFFSEDHCNEDGLVEYYCNDNMLQEENVLCDCLGGTCVDFDSEWGQFMEWMDEKGYNEIIKQKYRDYYEEIGITPREAMNILRAQGEGDFTFRFRPADNSFYNFYKNSPKTQIIPLNIVLFYPTEEGWTNALSIDKVARNKGYPSGDAYIKTIENITSKAIGRKVKINIQKVNISYTDAFLCPECTYTQEDIAETPLNLNQIGINGTVRGYINLDWNYFETNYVYRSDYSSRYPPIVIVIPMGKITPSGYLLGPYYGIVNVRSDGGLGTVAGRGDDLHNNVAMFHLGLLDSMIFIHELGHVFRFQHLRFNEEGRIWSIIPSLTPMNYNFAGHGIFPCEEILENNTLYAPLESYTMEPYSGFYNEEEHIRQYNTMYNDFVTCP